MEWTGQVFLEKLYRASDLMRTYPEYDADCDSGDESDCKSDRSTNSTAAAAPENYLTSLPDTFGPGMGQLQLSTPSLIPPPSPPSPPLSTPPL